MDAVGRGRGAHAAQVAAAAELLSQLLVESMAYRLRWQRHARRLSDQAVHQGAVAQVLADYLWDEGEVPETQTELPRQLKDTVSRALTGKALTPQTLRMFIEAFQMTATDTAQLWGHLTASEPGRLTVVRGGGTNRREVPVGPRTYRTIALHEFHRIGADGLPSEHRTLQVIRATQPTLHHTYRFDTNAVAIEVLRGGSAGELYGQGAGLHAVDITLDGPLEPGQTASLEYRTIFSYTITPPPEFRRAALQRLENVELNVQFHPDRVPSRLWWGEWDELDGPVSRQEPVQLSPALSAHRYLEGMENVTAGFHWTW